MQIFLDGQELDLNPNERIALTFQISDIADLSKANTSYTNKFKIPKTEKNLRILHYLGVPGNLSRKPYILNNVTVLEDSILILGNGYCEISDANGKEYNINIYGSEKTFFEKLKNYTLKDIYPTTNIIWTAQNLLNYVNSSSNFCFPVAQYNGESFHSGSLQTSGTAYSRTKATSSTPVFFVRYIFESIFSFLGYTVTYPMQTNSIFSKLVLPAQKGVSHFGIQHGDTFNLKNCVHEVACEVLIKELMHRYGLILKVDEINKKVTFQRMDNLLRSSLIIDWTDKFSSFGNEKYFLDGYAQKNYFKYSEDEADINMPELFPSDELIGSFNIQNETLDKEKTIIESAFKKPKMSRPIESNTNAKGRIFFPTSNGINYFLLDLAENTLENDGTYKIKEIPFQLMYLRNIGPTPINFSFIEPSGTQRTAIQIQGRTCSKDNISFQQFINENYVEVKNLLDTMNITKVTMKLSVLDIYRFDFFSRVYLQQFGCFFYVNKITNWQKDKLVDVELIKIPSVVSTGGGYGYSNNNMIGSL